MTRTTPLAVYIRMIEDFLGERTRAYKFAGAFFREFKEDHAIRGGQAYEALNAVALAAEAYEPGARVSRFDVTEDQLREECRRWLPVLRAATTT